MKNKALIWILIVVLTPGCATTALIDELRLGWPPAEEDSCMVRIELPHYTSDTPLACAVATKVGAALLLPLALVFDGVSTVLLLPALPWLSRPGPDGHRP